MANTDKDIVITPNRGSGTADPTIRFTGGNANVAASVNVSMYADGTLSFDGTAGQLFSITNSLTGTIFSVNDVSGIPSIEVLDSGVIKLAQYNGNVGIGTATVKSGVELAVFGGNIQLGTSGRAIEFPDGTRQTTAFISPVAVNQGGTGLQSGTSGGVLYYSAAGTLASSGALTASALVVGGGAGGAPSTITTGTGVVTALGVNTGSAGAFVTFNGALGTPSSGTLTNCTFPTLNQNTSGYAAGIAGGALGQLLYQTGANATGFVGVGTAGWVLTGAGSALPQWTQTATTNTASTIVQRDASGNFSAGTITATLSGNATSATTASSATTATTATNIAGGTTGQLHYQSGAGATAFVGVGTSGYVLTGAGAALPQWTLATNANTASTIVQRDASGNFSAGTITATLSGSATSAGTATTATTATNIAGGTNGQIPYNTGAGATSFIGVGTSGYVLTGAGAALPQWTQATNANTASTIVQRDASGNFSAGTITASLTGTASTATNLAGGTAGALAYQTGAGATSFISAGSSGTVLTGTGGTPAYSASPTLTTSVTVPIVYGGTAVSSSLTLQSTSGAGTSDSILFKVGNAGATTAMTINTVGNVGIGTTNPLALFVVGSLGSTGGESTYGGYMKINANKDFVTTAGGTAGDSGLEFKSSTTTSGYGWIISNPDRTGGNTPLSFAYRNNSATWTELITMRSDTGRVGVGTISPASRLSVYGGNVQIDTGSNNYGIVFSDSTYQKSAYPGPGTGTSGGVLYFSSSSTLASSGTLAASSLVVGGGAGAAPSTITTGTGVVTALGVAVGSAGAFVTFNGALGTPSSGTLTNCTFPTLNQNTTGYAAGIAGGALGQLHYQTGANATGFVGVGTAGWVLTGAGSALPQWTQATNANTASTIVQRDASGNFSAGTITATLSGSATSAGTATTATTATNIASGTTGQIPYQSGAGATSFIGVGTSGWVLTGAGAALPQWTQATNANTASTIVQRDASGNFSAGTITASLTGTASTATNVAGGSAGAIHYQSGAGTTAFVGVGTSGWFLTGAGAALPQWTQVVPVANGGTNLSSGTSGGVLYYSAAGTLASSGTLAASAIVVGGGAGVAPSTITTGTGVVTALGVAVGSAGAFVTFNGALGTPSSGTLTNCTFPTLNQNTTGYAAGIAGGALGQLHYQTGANTTGFVGVGTSGWVLTGAGSALPQWTLATNANTASTIVQRDASGNFSAGTITASLTGTASTATNLAGGTAGALAYQTGAGATSFISAGASGTVLTGTGGTPAYSASPTITSLTVPTIYGGTAAGSTLTLQSTSGAGGSTDSIIFKVGNAGGVTAMTVDKTGNVGIGTSTATADLQVHGNMSVRWFIEFEQTIDANYTIRTGYNAMTAGPITINSGVTVTVPSGSTWTII